jgi:hypothetical protein
LLFHPFIFGAIMQPQDTLDFFPTGSDDDIGMTAYFYHGEIPFPIICRGCGVRLPFTSVGYECRYKHPPLGKTGCTCARRFTVVQHHAVEWACRALRDHGILRPDVTVAEQLSHVQALVAYFFNDEWSGTILLKDEVVLLPGYHEREMTET